ncbi:tyrosine-type recombinase/integrase [Fructilactobacillus sp. Tb1]|uniref:tyrosine-type recombinase/integrase n=1 Tax=Fructilactobacillus sp. Tb1 TaxID=3422304 RepID=UPI003D26E10D
MASYIKYKDKNGKEFYKVQAYLGIDPQTGMKKTTTLRGFRTKRQASNAVVKAKNDFIHGKIKKPQHITFKECEEAWWIGYKNRSRESTLVTVSGMFKNHILPAFGNKRVNTITIAQIQRIVNSWVKLAPSNFVKWYNYTSCVLDYAVRAGYVQRNVAKLIELPKKPEKVENDGFKFWDKEQLNIFFNYLDYDKKPQVYTMFRVLAYSGIRKGEMLALTWDDIDFNNNTIRINKTLAKVFNGVKVQPPKTKNSYRTLDMDNTTMMYLKRWRMDQRRLGLMLGFNTNKKSQLVFNNTKNNHHTLATTGKWLNTIIKATGLPHIKVHGLRHSHASALFAAGVSIKQVQERLGHSNAQTTLNIYTHVTQKQNAETINKFVDYLDK